MAPQNRPSARHQDPHNVQHNTNATADAASGAVENDELFLEPMMGTPLAIYIEKDVADRDRLVEIITKCGGSISPGYSGVPYILVDPHKESGQSLFRQYAGKKGKIVLDARWVHECVRAGELQAFQQNWAGCKVTGTEQQGPPAGGATPAGRSSQASRRGRPSARAQAHAQTQPPPTGSQASTTSYVHPPQPLQPPPVMHPAVPPPMPPNFPYPVYAGQNPASRGAMQPPTSAPPQTWQAPNGLAPHQAHVPHPQMIPPPPRAQNPYGRDEHWTESGFPHIGAPPPDANTLPAMNEGHANGYYDQRYREGQGAWPENTQDYYDQQSQPYTQSYQQPPEPYIPVPGPSTAVESFVSPSTGADRQRGRKRTRTQPAPAPPASTLVLNRRHPPARSPTPPTRVIKSTYGGNLFTADDVMYLKKYIDYCQEQGLVLSLREICERIAVKAPHHTFYSWRRYCNKHQIRLGGYAMDVDSRSASPTGNGQIPLPYDGQAPAEPDQPRGQGPFTILAAQHQLQEQGMRNRSPTPPRALYRSTTGKGVAFTDEDITFLCRFLAYRKAQQRLDMVTFWKDVANKAPHHSRASWMKYYRRHKHELNRVEGDEPLPAPPAKKMRYGKNDDILLARHFRGKPEGTSDKIFQDFAKLHPHHPWKGWQEHHRIHKAKIDHLIQRLNSGEHIDIGDEDE